MSKWRLRDSSLLSHPLDYFMLAFPLAYILSAFNAVNQGLAVDEIAEVVLYFLFYWCAVSIAGNRKYVEIILFIIYTGGVAVALAGLMTATGMINIKEGVQQAVRIASTLQYPNALAGYLVAVFTAGVYLWRKYSFSQYEPGDIAYQSRHGNFLIYFFAAGNFLLAAVIFGTKSNGGYMAFALAVLLLLAFLPGWNRLSVFIHLAAVVSPAAAVMYYFQQSVLAHHYLPAWLYILLGLLLVVLIQWLYLRYIPVFSIQIKRNSVQKSLLAGTGAVLLLTVVLLIIFSNKIIALVQGFIKIRSVLDRAYFIQDALHMFKERPFWGWGGGGWQEAYHFYQSFSYVSTQVHSYFTQIAIETGITGLLVVAGIWLFFLISGRRAFRKCDNVNDKVLVAALTVGVLSLGFHAAIDFDLSFAAISMVLFTYMAIVRSLERPPSQRTDKEKNTKPSKSVFIMASAAALVLIIFTGSLLTAASYRKDALDFIKQNNYGKATQFLEKAVAINPFRAEYSHALAELYRSTGQKDKAWEEALKAADKSKYEPHRRALLASLALDRGDFEESSMYIEEVLRLAPWVISGYESAGVVYKGMGLTELKKNNNLSASKYFKAAAALPDTVKNKIDSLDPNRKKLILNFDVTSKLLLQAGISNFMLGDTAKAEYQLKKASLNRETKGEALVWLCLLSEKTGNPGDAVSYLNQAKEISPEFEKAYGEFKQLIK